MGSLFLDFKAPNRGLVHTVRAEPVSPELGGAQWCVGGALECGLAGGLRGSTGGHEGPGGLCAGEEWPLRYLNQQGYCFSRFEPPQWLRARDGILRCTMKIWELGLAQ